MNTKNSVRAPVYLNSRYVGFLLHKDGYGTFTYEDLAPDHPVLGLRFEYDPDYGSQRAVSAPTWFANLLPERGSGLRALYARQLGRSDASDFLLLVYLGGDLPGAVRVEVESELPAQMTEALEAAAARRGRPKMSFSLSGMQLKFSMLKRGDNFVLPDSGEFGDWIVKLPSNVYPAMPANENTMMTWASAGGIRIPEHHLVSAEQLSGLPEGVIGEGELAFAVRRFDRSPEGRVHQEDFAQVLDAIPAAKDRGSQELIGRVVLDECPEYDFEEYVRRLTFCVISGNTDEHLKNWSLQYPDARSPRLSPAYDLASVTAYSQFRNDVLTLAIAGQPDTRYLELGHFRQFAESLEADPNLTSAVVVNTVQALRDSWPAISIDPQVPGFVAEHVQHRLSTLPLAKA
jgi:serine/threonine-protein kinase HipA